MAEKFPMTVEEAAGYIQNHYGDKCGVTVRGDKIEVMLTVVINVPATERIDPRYRDFPQEYQQILSPNSHSYQRQTIEYVYISDFKKTAIDEKIKKAMKDHHV